MFANQAALPSIYSNNNQVRFAPIPSRFSVQASGNSCATSTVGSESEMMMMKKKNLYEVLKLERSASRAEIKAAYRTLVKQFHPDANRSGSEDFIEIHNAYSTLSDPMSRARYDLCLSISLPSYRRRTATDSNSSYYVGKHTRFTRWETDQCW